MARCRPYAQQDRVTRGAPVAATTMVVTEAVTTALDRMAHQLVVEAQWIQQVYWDCCSSLAPRGEEYDLIVQARPQEDSR